MGNTYVDLTIPAGKYDVNVSGAGTYNATYLYREQKLIRKSAWAFLRRQQEKRCSYISDLPQVLHFMGIKRAG